MVVKKKRKGILKFLHGNLLDVDSAPENHYQKEKSLHVLCDFEYVSTLSLNDNHNYYDKLS